MGACDDFIKKIEKTLPDLCTVKDLIKVGFYKSPQAARSARIANCSPPYFKLGEKKIIFPKEGIIRWLKKGKNASWDSECNQISYPPHIEKVESVYQGARLA